MAGKACLITGASSGIGKATAMELADKGTSAVLFRRDREKENQPKQK